MADKVVLRICNESRKLKCGYSCNRRGAEKLIESISRYLSENGLEDRVEVLPSSCMKNCSQGISIETPKSGELFSRMKDEHIPEFIDYILGKAQQAPCPVVLMPLREIEPVKK